MSFHARKSFTIRDQRNENVAVVSESPNGLLLIIHNLKTDETMSLPLQIAESLSEAIAEFRPRWDD